MRTTYQLHKYEIPGQYLFVFSHAAIIVPAKTMHIVMGHFLASVNLSTSSFNNKTQVFLEFNCV